MDKIDTRDLRLAEIATKQHGIVTTRQLVSLGFARSAVAARARRGRLHRIHRGVYAVGHRALGDDGRRMAAVLACGPGAVLSHVGAAAHWGMLGPEQGPLDVSVPSRAGRRRPGINLHRCPSLAASPRPRPGSGGALGLVTRHRGIPVTTPTRTLADLEGVVPDWLFRRARRQAEHLSLPLAEDHRGDRTRSDLERDFLRFCRRHGLPSPEVNVRVGRWTVDFLWRPERLVVETDGYRYHRGRVAFEEDRERDLGLRALGYDVIRIADRQLDSRAGSLAGILAEELARRGDR